MLLTNTMVNRGTASGLRRDAVDIVFAYEKIGGFSDNWYTNKGDGILTLLFNCTSYTGSGGPPVTCHRR